MSQGIYSITNEVNNKRYIGMSTKIENRFYYHKYELNNNKHSNKHLQNAWNKHRKNNFVFEVLEIVEDVEDLPEREKYYIALYDSFKHGYNSSLGGDGQKGFIIDEERLMKMSEAMKGNQYGLGHEMSEESKKNMRKNLSLVKQQPKYRKIARNNLKKSWENPEFRKKMAILNKGNKYGLGRKISESHKQLLSKIHSGKGNPFYGKTHNEESKVKMSEHNKRLWKDNEYREKMAAIKKEYMNTEEYKQKQSLKSRGENNAKSSLKEIDVINIRLRYLKGEKPKDIIKDYPQMKKSGLQKVYLNNSWKHIPNNIEELEYMLINYQSQ